MPISGLANLCSAKWKDPKFLHRKIANQLIGCLEHCDLTQGDVGVTFESDHVQANGLTSEKLLLLLLLYMLVTVGLFSLSMYYDILIHTCMKQDQSYFGQVFYLREDNFGLNYKKMFA